MIQPIPMFGSKLSRKIVGMLVVFFVVALSAIGLTLYLSWQLEGVAAAINDAGSQRMRTYRIALLMARDAPADRLAVERRRFDKVLDDLRRGDPERPLSPPGSAEIAERLDSVARSWEGEIRPLLSDYQAGDAELRRQTVRRFDAALEGFVAQINELVLAMEHSYAGQTNLLRTAQAALVLLAVVGTTLLISFFIRLVIRPVNVLHACMRRMTGSDLSVRVPIASDDELGGLARGFNQMAEHLQFAYGTLEERIAAETRSLAQRNRELGILYEATAFLSEPAPLPALCEGFLWHIRRALGADAGAVRLFSPDTEKLHLMAHEGLSPEFVANEAALDCSDCLCGEVQQAGTPLVFATVDPPPGMKMRTCIRDGFATAAAFSIMYDRQRLGVFNLYYRTPRQMSAPEEHLLETLGQHLGVAIENQRLKRRERELAVSEERNLLAQELHDSIAQGLAFLNLQVQLLQDSLKRSRVDEALQTAGQLREGVQESYDHVRELLVHFRTRVHQSDLDSAIQEALAKFEEQTGIATGFERIGTAHPLASGDEIQVMHIIQEALSNIRKHARAGHVQVVVRRDGGGLEVQVEDDGVGFDPDTDPRTRSERHVGLKIMHERALRIGGECRITSRPGGGTCVTLSLPAETREKLSQ